jgi:peptidyl-tRNA hydrolase, PTH1 family
MAILLVGLGNIGEKYHDTRHNIGFSVLDALAQKKGLRFESGRLASIAKFQTSGTTVYLIKPTTFMNLSGDAVSYWMKAASSDVSEIMVITDDISLPFGKIRIRPKGSSGGHNGLSDVELKIKSQEYPRMRMGIGSDFSKGKQVDYVLGKFNPDESIQLPEWIEKAVEACLCFCSRGIQVTMNQFNS